MSVNKILKKLSEKKFSAAVIYFIQAKLHSFNQI